MVEVEWAGQVAYAEAWQWQKILVAERSEAAELAHKLLLLEHPHTYTLGRRGKMENLLLNQAELDARGITVHRVDRGGDITYHGPGQLVGYPILNMRQLGRQGLGRMRAYVEDIENVLIQTLAAFDLKACRYPGFTGVWVDTEQGLEKIAAIGIRINNAGVSSHGFALNVNTDLSYFSGIIPCGIDDHGVTSMEQVLERPLHTTDIIPYLIDAFGRIFQVEMAQKINV